MFASGCNCVSFCLVETKSVDSHQFFTKVRSKLLLVRSVNAIMNTSNPNSTYFI